MMSAEAVLYSPIPNWREQCTRIVKYIEAHRAADRYIYRLDRSRPKGALLLRDMLDAFWEYGQRFFWRLQYPQVTKFEFDGNIDEPSQDVPFPAYGEIGCLNKRSIEDVNLVTNTYTSFFIFRDELEALTGADFVHENFHKC